MPFGAGWSDLGGWEAVWLESGPDAQGNVCSDNATAIDRTNTLLRSETDGLQLVGLGLDNIVAIAMGDAVLVADKSQAQRVKEAVDELKAKGSSQGQPIATRLPSLGLVRKLCYWRKVPSEAYRS
jgi:mannose-1-phosphate guanylyltransferase / mannose-6-phosphate isomerase